MHDEQTPDTGRSVCRTDRRSAGSAAADAAQGADIHYLLACISYDMKDYASAERSLEIALSHLPDCEELLTLYAEVLWRQDKHEKARDVLERGLTVSRHNQQLLMLRETMQASRECPPAPDAGT